MGETRHRLQKFNYRASWMKILKLTKGKSTTVNNDVFRWAKKFKWYALKIDRRFYAARTAHIKGKKHTSYLHREIINPGPKLQVDHRDGDGLNNLRRNLRSATNQQNQMARQRPMANKSSKFRGVSWVIRDQNWLVNIQINGKRFRLGQYSNENAAARAYDKKALELFGKFASPNFSK